MESWGAMKCTENPPSKLRTAMAVLNFDGGFSAYGIIWCHFQLQVSNQAAKSMTNLTSQSCDDLQLAVCLPREDGVIKRPPKHLSTFDKP